MMGTSIFLVRFYLFAFTVEERLTEALDLEHTHKHYANEEVTIHLVARDGLHEFTSVEPRSALRWRNLSRAMPALRL